MRPFFQVRTAAAARPRPEAVADDLVRLVRAAQTGDRGAFAELYARYTRLVHGVLMAHAPWAEVEDLVQDVFLTAMERLTGLNEPAAFGGWVSAIARNRAVDASRRQRPTTELPDTLAAPGGDRGEAFAVLAVIRRLPEAYRETLTLRLVEGMTGPEIAARTGLTEGSVRVNLHRGMKLLREHLAGGLK
jgi:RNA polymerase sigma-70 factor (ECF subfamily)